MMDLYLFFQFVKEHCHGNQIMLQNCYQRLLIPLAFVAIVLENLLQYHGLAVRINSAYDVCISCENFVKFGQVTPELKIMVNISSVVFELKWGIENENCAATRPKLAYIVEYINNY